MGNIPIQRMRFNPRTRRGCDPAGQSQRVSDGGFNPRTRRGCDRITIFRISRSAFQSTHPQGVRPFSTRSISVCSVSIHAPAGGATESSTCLAATCQFQSTHPQGVRRGEDGDLAEEFKFQSTHPQGVRPTSMISLSILTTFQSTHPQGVRQRHLQFWRLDR